ncbi:unnamed protein product [Albugo candida]|uniref:Uncharacterized protein n=1 Tax=Albugo candida TaxID=65357 RepID=A0A024GU71_9STRA|nr:unnamed protein product [Albugo candida]|eukprot:CCI50474.1 unnamed protein product [Albugo candida]
MSFRSCIFPYFSCRYMSSPARRRNWRHTSMSSILEPSLIWMPIQFLFVTSKNRKTSNIIVRFSAESKFFQHRITTLCKTVDAKTFIFLSDNPSIIYTLEDGEVRANQKMVGHILQHRSDHSLPYKILNTIFRQRALTYSSSLC